MTTAILVFEDLPMEIIVVIFNHLNIQDLQQCCQTCTKWKNVIVQFFFRPQLRTLAMVGLQCHMPDHSGLKIRKKCYLGKLQYLLQKLKSRFCENNFEQNDAEGA